jgi:hypothetical protein
VVDKFLKLHVKILLDFNAKVGRENIFKPTIGNERLHKISNDNWVGFHVSMAHSQVQREEWLPAIEVSCEYIE